MATNVRVVCRFRPENKREVESGGATNISIDPSGTTVSLTTADHLKFTFDKVFPPTCRQVEVYDETARPVIDDVLKGYNGTVFVYGQTGSGKTFTMQGPSIDDEELKGIIPRMIRGIFEGISKADSSIEFLVKSSYMEIYMEKIQDLLDSSRVNLKVREEKAKGIWVEGLTDVYINSEQDILDVLRAGQANRAVAETSTFLCAC